MKVFYLKFIIMDYEKKYKEALERAKNYHDNNFSFGTTKLTEAIFPELRESEDERIIEEIKFAVMQMPSERKDTKNRCLAWLEKQKESHIPWYDYQKSKEAGYTIIPNEEYEQLIKQKEQKPQVFCEAKAYDLGYKQGKEDAIKEQKPEEWSEEDEDILNCCISSIEEAKENRYAYKETDGDTSYDREIDWLKSLRPSWKPSEEQMDALKELIDDANKAGWVTPGATELYEQLKKL